MDMKPKYLSITPSNQRNLELSTTRITQYFTAQRNQDFPSGSTVGKDIESTCTEDLFVKACSSDTCLTPPACCYEIHKQFTVQQSAVTACWYNTNESFLKHLIAGLDINEKIPSRTIIEMKPYFALTYAEKGKTISECIQSSYYPDMTILHLASGIGNYKIVQVLLQEENIDVYITDSSGNTPLHYCAMAKYHARGVLSDHGRCACLLLNKGGVDLIKKQNNDSSTCFQAATKSKNFSALRIILQHGKQSQDLIPRNDLENTLTKLAELKPYEIEIENENVIAECIELLLQLYMVNADTEKSNFALILMQKSAHSSNVSVLKAIMSYGEIKNQFKHRKGHNLLQYTVDKHVETLQCVEKTIECLDYLTNECKVDINSENITGKTLLITALKRNNQQIALHLLKRGACINDFRCDGGELLNLFHPDTLTLYFNEHVKRAEHREYYDVNFDFDFLKKCAKCTTCEALQKFKKLPNEDVNEMNFVTYLAKKDHMKHLLAHPLILCFILLKYYKTGILRWVTMNTIMYLVYFITLNIYISNIVLKSEISRIPLMSIIGISVVYVGCKEVLQALTERTKYLMNFQNWIEVPLLIYTVTLITKPSDISDETTQQLAITALLSWFMFVLETGKMSFFSMQFKIFRTVMSTYFYYMLWYCIILFGYAEVFFILFYNKNSEKIENVAKDNSNEQSNNGNKMTFNNLWLSIETSLVMMTGELNYDSFKLKNWTIFEHVVLASFVLVCVIVLLNLLQGLTVYDTEAIIQNATILSVIARVQEIERVEKLLLNFRSIFPWCTALNICNTALVPRLTSNNDHQKKITYNMTVYRNDKVSLTSLLSLIIRTIPHYFISTDSELIDPLLNESTCKLISELLNKDIIMRQQEFEANSFKELKDYIKDINVKVLLNNKEFQELKTSLLLINKQLQELKTSSHDT